MKWIVIAVVALVAAAALAFAAICLMIWATDNPPPRDEY